MYFHTTIFQGVRSVVQAAYTSVVSATTSSANFLYGNRNENTLPLVLKAAASGLIQSKHKRISFEAKTTVDQAFNELIQSGLSRTEMKKRVREFVEAYWVNFHLPKGCNTEKNKEFLANKLFVLLVDHKSQSIRLRRKIFRNVIKNYQFFLRDSFIRVHRDIQKDRTFQKLFALHGNEQIHSFEMLADETHDKGSGPILVMIRLSNHRKIVYKPRSMLNEATICGSNTGSLFKAANLGTYRVHVNKEGYGYCDFLENEEHQNTVKHTAELATYFQQFDLMDQLMAELGISDLHRDNVVTRNMTPYLIDLEVLAPKNTKAFETGLVSGFSAGCIYTSDSKNRIWFSPDPEADLSIQQARKEVEVETQLGAGFLSEMSVLGIFQTLSLVSLSETRLRKKKVTALSPRVKVYLDKTRKALYGQNHRIVLIDTRLLNQLIKESPAIAITEFENGLQEGLAEWGLLFNDALKSQIVAKFREDLENNDIPVFYYNPKYRAVYYHGIKING